MKDLATIVAAIALTGCGEAGYDDYGSDSGSNEEDANECCDKYGTHSASVDYYNPDAGHSNTYNSEVEIEDCTIIQINIRTEAG